MGPSLRKSRVVVLATATVAFGGLIATAMVSQTGCQLQGACATSNVVVPTPTATLPNSGAIDSNTWQSNGLDDPWLYFPGQRTYTIFPLLTSSLYSPRFYGPDWDIFVWVATDPQPASTGNYTLASGNIAEIFLVTDPTESQYAADAATPPPAFNLVNASCADYYVRIEIVRHPSEDAGAADAGPLDAAPDADLGAEASL